MKPFLLAVSLAVATALGAGETITVPDRFLWRNGEPIWIAASEAVSGEGWVRPGVLRPGESALLRDFRERGLARRGRSSVAQNDAAPCDVLFTELIADGSELFEARSLGELADVAASRNVIDGVVTASAVGLHAGVPYTILQVATDSGDAPGSPVYVLYSKGRMTFDGMTVCNDDGSFGATPAAGDRIAFVAGEAIDSTGLLFRPAGSWVVSEREGHVVTGPALRDKVGSVRDAVARLRGGRPHEAPASDRLERNESSPPHRLHASCAPSQLPRRTARSR